MIVISTIFVWLFFLLGVAAHTYWQANKSAKNQFTPWQSVTQYLNRYSGIIIVRTVIAIVIYGIWWSNPDALLKLSTAMAAKAQGAGWEKAAIVFGAIRISPLNVFVALGFGVSTDAILFMLAKYIPGFKSVVPDFPVEPEFTDAGAVAREQKKTEEGNK